MVKWGAKKRCVLIDTIPTLLVIGNKKKRFLIIKDVIIVPTSEEKKMALNDANLKIKVIVYPFFSQFKIFLK